MTNHSIIIAFVLIIGILSVTTALIAWRSTTNDTGPVGPKGFGGPEGIQGPKGDQGLKGDTGTAGALGPQGDRGPAGQSGQPGSRGQTGLQGQQGPAGPGFTEAPTVWAYDKPTLVDPQPPQLYVSVSDGLTWAPKIVLTNGPYVSPSQPWPLGPTRSVASNGEVIVAVGSGLILDPGTNTYAPIWVSQNVGSSWSAADYRPSTDVPFYCVTWTGTHFIAGSTGNQFITSTDGLTWTTLLNASTLGGSTMGPFTDVIWDGTNAIFSCFDGNIYSSSTFDENSFVATPIFTTGQCNSLAYSKSLGYVVGGVDASVGTIAYFSSLSGTISTKIFALTTSVNCVRTNNSKFVITLSVLSGEPDAILSSSSPGGSWTRNRSGAGFSARGSQVHWNGRYWIVRGNADNTFDTLLYSLDGLAWSNAALTSGAPVRLQPDDLSECTIWSPNIWSLRPNLPDILMALVRSNFYEDSQYTLN
jgi:hypothetical protein